jgi:uncharacterized protein YndB with AHSA1/START domain
MASVTETAIVRELTIDARPETVWEFLVDSEKATQWMGVTATLEPRPGGVYRVEVLPGMIAGGTFVELDPPRRVVFTWGWEPGTMDGSPGSEVLPGTSTIEIELEPHGEGTQLRFVHRDLPGAAAVAAHGEGWAHYLARLGTVASGDDPCRDPWLDRQA